MGFHIQEVMLSDISAETNAADALRDWNGFIQLEPAVRPSQTMLIFALDNREEAHWKRIKHWKPVSALLSPIGRLPPAAGPGDLRPGLSALRLISHQRSFHHSQGIPGVDTAA